MQKTFFLIGSPIRLIILLSFSIITLVNAKIEPPNYDFSLDNLKVFYPGGQFNQIQKKWGSFELAFEQGDSKIYKFYVSHIRYKFPVFVQIANEKAVSFYARLPSYFLHDIFHQSLINRYGKQDEYVKKESVATYIWNEKNGLKLTYQGQCTITCFPMYLIVSSSDSKDKQVTPINFLELFNPEKIND